MNSDSEIEAESGDVDKEESQNLLDRGSGSAHEKFSNAEMRKYEEN